MKKEKLSILQQVEHMEQQGIRFTLTTKSEAKAFLENNTYYFKLKAYAKNYSKYKNGEKAGQYCNLEFAYLVDLSTIDSHLRKLIIKMSLDIEHFLKVKLLRDFITDGIEDGYSIIEAFFERNPSIKQEIIDKGKNSYCAEMIQKYKDDFSIWNIVEILTFGQFVKLYSLYYERNYGLHKRDKDNILNELMPVRLLRNAAAHNNCLLHKMGEPYTRKIEPNMAVNRIVSQIPGVPKKSVGKKMRNPVIHDFAVLLHVFDTIVTSPKLKQKTYRELKELFEVRIPEHKDYYADNQLLVSNYIFAKVIVEYFTAQLTES